MPRKKKPKPDDKEQSARFLEKATQVQSNDPKKAFEKTLNIILKKSSKSN